ncbi:hypothetical protein HZA33_03250 [Candidatus Pacearchaeota archaeon]|nr:hypothetical protein [Candidatus Pacearchaeota archaeon]
MSEQYPIFRIQYSDHLSTLRHPFDTAIVAESSEEDAKSMLVKILEQTHPEIVKIEKTGFFATEKGIINLY